MPAVSLRSRIQAFEALSSSSSPTMPDTSPTEPSLHLLESPISPTATSFHPITPFLVLSSSSRSRSPSPLTPNLPDQTPLTDLKDWIVEDGPVEPPSPSHHTLIAGLRKLNGTREPSRTPSPSGRHRGPSNSSTPLINFDPPSKLRPPLPPRKPIHNVKVAVDRVSTQHSTPAGTETVATLRPASLTIEHTYPPGPRKFGAGRVGHVPTSSISSFHSVSLSSDDSPAISSQPPSSAFEIDSSIADFDTASIAESFENVSTPSVHSPFDWEQPTTKPKASPRLEPPSLPNRASVVIAPVAPHKPLARSISVSSSSTATTTKTRRPPPPPPPYQPRSRPCSSRASVVSTSASTSDRSSILSNATTTSRTSISTRSSAQPGTSVKPSPLLRPTPVPSAARSRYESLFDSGVRGRRKATEKKQKKNKLLAPPPFTSQKGQQAGWRDLSVDCATDQGNHPNPYSEKQSDESDNEEDNEPVGPEERLNGRIVKYIWNASRLDRKKLGNIWNDCDPQGTGSIDRDTFVRGMWRIDEELRRAQLAQRTSALSAASSQRIPHRPFLPPRSQSAIRLLI